jgi:hypothetical protein
MDAREADTEIPQQQRCAIPSKSDLAGNKITQDNKEKQPPEPIKAVQREHQIHNPTSLAQSCQKKKIPFLSEHPIPHIQSHPSNETLTYSHPST